MSTPENLVERDESSGVTTLRPVPAKPARLFDLAESDSTSYFSASELLERGKALVARASEPAPPLTEQAPSTSETATPRPGWAAQFRQASLARQAIAILLPVLCGLLLLTKPLLEKTRHAAPSKPSASAGAPNVSTQPKPASPLPVASVAMIALPRGMTTAHAAADSVATGDFSRAASLYRELARREPKNQAYREAARILSERTQGRTP